MPGSQADAGYAALLCTNANVRVPCSLAAHAGRIVAALAMLATAEAVMVLTAVAAGRVDTFIGADRPAGS